MLFSNKILSLSTPIHYNDNAVYFRTTFRVKQDLLKKQSGLTPYADIHVSL